MAGFILIPNRPKISIRDPTLALYSSTGAWPNATTISITYCQYGHFQAIRRSLLVLRARSAGIARTRAFVRVGWARVPRMCRGVRARDVPRC